MTEREEERENRGEGREQEKREKLEGEIEKTRERAGRREKEQAPTSLQRPAHGCCKHPKSEPMDGRKIDQSISLSPKWTKINAT